MNCKNTSQVTLCLTIGGRPEKLKETIESLLKYVDFEHVIAINDFRDDATNQVFKELFPNGKLLLFSEQLGHHAAVDAMYKEVKTPYVFHCEDDWLFDGDMDMPAIIKALEANPELSSVGFRKASDFNFSDEALSKITSHKSNDFHYQRLDPLHDQWYNYSFNPHVVNLDLWKSLGGFVKFKKERHISRWIRSQGKFIAFIEPGTCHHIGWGVSMGNPPPTNIFSKIKAKIFG